MNTVFSIFRSMYIVGYPEGILSILLCVSDREVKPLIVAIGIGVILHEERVVIGSVFIKKGAL